MTVEELLRQVEQVGGSLALRGDRIVYRLPKDATPILAELKTHRDEVLMILKRRSSTPTPERDPYAERMQVALRKINSPAYPAGMILWLEKTEPELHAELTERLPDEIHRLWEAHAPLERFEKTLSRLVSEHRRACALYRAYLATQHVQDGGAP